MSSRKIETYIYAIDSNGNQHDISYIYTYAGGNYHQVTCIGDKEYLVVADGTGDSTEHGSYLPTLGIEDLESYFGAQPTKDMSLAIQEASVASCGIENFVCSCTLFAGSSPYTTKVTVIGASGKTEKSFPSDATHEIADYIKGAIKNE